MSHGHHLAALRPGHGRTSVVIVGGLAELPGLLDEQLPTDAPLWWLKVDGFHTRPFTIRPIPEITSAFAMELLTAVPSGPIILIGFSYGGLLAFDLTCRLRQTGRVVHTILLETRSPVMLQDPLADGQGFPVTSGRATVKRLRHHLAALCAMSPTKWVRYFSGRIYEKLQVPLGGALPRHLPRLLRLIIRLRAALSTEQPTNLLWWHYGSQILDRVRTYKPVPCPGSIHIGGRAKWLDANGPAWEPLVTGKLIQVRRTSWRGSL